VLLTLHDGVIHESTQAEPSELQRTRFVQQQIEMKGVGTELRRSATEYRSDREMSVAMLQGVVDTARVELAGVRAEGRRISTESLERVLAGPAAARWAGPPPSAGVVMSARGIGGSD